MVDADPQCNLSGIVLNYKGIDEFERFYAQEARNNLRAGLAPAFESRPEPLRPVDCVELESRPGLFLLPGHIQLSEYEVTLGIAQELSGSIQTLQNLPGAISAVLELTAEKYEVDYVLVDMNPSLSSINQNILMTSDYFIIPASPDFFSVLAIDSLSNVLPRWCAWAKKARALEALRTAAYPFPAVHPRFLGTVIQKYRPRGGRASVDFQRWIDDINGKVVSKLLPVFHRDQMLLEDQAYAAAGLLVGRNLSLIPDFNTLIAKSQKTATPVFALTKKQLERSGQILKKTIENRKKFRRIFEDMADKVIMLTS